MSDKMLSLSECFYSVQCEGHTTGYPAFFIRLKGCNLSCGLTTKHTQEILRAGPNGTASGDFIGDLHANGSATWTCDTAPVWLFGNKTSFDDITTRWRDENIYDWVRDGRVHLIWTGGEPTIPKHQKDIVSFLSWLGEPRVFNEIETNGTFYIEDDLFNNLHQINCSVKLANSGMSKDKRIVAAALNRIMQHQNYWFKFVVSTEEDLQEIKADFIEPFNIPWNRTIIMPGLDSQSNFHERTRFILETAKKYGYIGLSRLHVSAYDKTTGV